MNYVRNAWYMAGWAQELARETLAAVTLLGMPLVLYKKRDGDWAALEDVCCHRLAPLSLGRLEGDELRCMYHGLKFGCDGRCTEIPGQAHVPEKVRVRAYPVEEKWGAVWVWMGDAARADIGLIPKIPDPGSTELAVRSDSAEVDGHAGLIWDNLLDLSHVAFVHLASFMGNDETMARIALAGENEHKRIEKTAKGVRVKRWHYDKQGHPLFGDITYDDCVLSDFDIPGYLLLEFRSYRQGVHQRHPGADIDAIPAEDWLSTRYSCQIVTPVDETRSRIFFSSGIDKDYGDRIDAIFSIVQKALIEDKIFVDAQQKVMTRFPERRVMTLGMDAPIMQFRSLVNQRLAEEAAG